MAYIGNTLQNQSYVPAIDYFSGNGSTTAFTLSRQVASVAQVQAVINNVPQHPSTAFSVSGNTITFTSAPPSGTNNIYVYYTSPNTQVIQPGDGTVGMTQLAQSLQTAMFGSFGFKNRIINGAMMIDQRNAGAAVAAGSYPVDRFVSISTAVTSAVVSTQQVSDAPTGFNYSLKYTVTTAGTAYTAGGRAGVLQRIEGYNFADFMYGSANAQTLTLSFWVKSSMTGSFSAALYNSDGTRSYPFSYTISVANTWEQKSVTITGDTTGTWLKDNGRGVQVEWCLGAESAKLGTANTWASAWYTGVTGTVELIKTLNATFQITGAQLEKGSTATSFDYRPYGTELALCQRYLPVIDTGTGGRNTTLCMAYDGTRALAVVAYPVPARTPATGLTYTGTATNLGMYQGSTSKTLTALAFNDSTYNTGIMLASVSSGLTGAQCVLLYGESVGGKFIFTGCEL